MMIDSFYCEVSTIWIKHILLQIIVFDKFFKFVMFLSEAILICCSVG